MRTLTKPVPADRSKIEIQKPEHVKAWVKKLNISPEELAKAVEKVGNNAAAVRKEIVRSERC